MELNFILYIKGKVYTEGSPTELPVKNKSGCIPFLQVGAVAVHTLCPNQWGSFFFSPISQQLRSFFNHSRPTNLVLLGVYIAMKSLFQCLLFADFC